MRDNMKFLVLGFDGFYRIESEPGYSTANYGESIDELLEGVVTVNGKQSKEFTEIAELPEKMKLTWSVLEPVVPVAYANVTAVDEEALEWAKNTFTIDEVSEYNTFTIYNEDVERLWDPEINKKIHDHRIVVTSFKLPNKSISPLRSRIVEGSYVEEFELIGLTFRALNDKGIHKLLASIGEHYGLSDEYDGQPQFIDIDEVRLSDLGYVEADIISVAGTFTHSRLHIPTFMLYLSAEEAEKHMESTVCKFIKETNEAKAKEFDEFVNGVEEILEIMKESDAEYDWDEAMKILKE